MPAKPDAQFFKDLSLEWMEAWKGRDKKRLNSILADDFLYISRMVKDMCVGKKEWLRMTMELYKLESYKLEFVCLKIREQLAIVVYKQTMKTSPDHTGESTLHIVTDVWTLGDQGWQ